MRFRLNPGHGLLLVSVVSFGLLCGCAANDKEVSFNSGGMTHTFSEGQAAANKDFPLPVYPNAKPTGSVNSQGDGEENSQFLMLVSSDKPEQIKQYYTDELKKTGWDVKETSTIASLVNLAASKNDLQANVMVSAADGKETTINLSVSKEPEGAPKPAAATGTPDKFNPPTD